jgi:hypothetical protein
MDKLAQLYSNSTDSLPAFTAAFPHGLAAVGAGKIGIRMQCHIFLFAHVNGVVAYIENILVALTILTQLSFVKHPVTFRAAGSFMRDSNWLFLEILDAGTHMAIRL